MTTSPLVSSLRVFNRFYTGVIGVLSDSHLGIGLTLGQGRVLYEIGQLAPVEARALQAHLGLDAGYLSRRLAELDNAGLVSRKATATDARVKRITVTAKGQKWLDRIDQKSDAAAAALLKGLAKDEVARLAAAMGDIQKLLGGTVDIAPAPADGAESQACLHAYFSELSRRFPRGFDPAASVSAEPDELSPPHGRFVLVRSGQRPRGCGAVKRLDVGVGEIKRMWVHPELRGRGVGRALLDALEVEARRLGFHTVRLDTSAHLPEALALYRRAGYRDIPRYNDNPYAAHWLEKRLRRRRRCD